ncbi:MAG: hypothetical protein JWN25_3154 [Verrucomicrobiales bacterium]|nr:hypothetical protein [Verrucomicrobiales bacterium]
MSPLQSRRNFLLSSALATTAVAFGSMVESQAMEKLARKGEPRLFLSLAAYSFRDYFKDSTSKPNPAIPESKKIDLFDFIDYCGANGCIGAELTSYYFPKEISNDFLLKLRRHAFLRGVPISGSAVGNTFTLPKGEKRDKEIQHVKDWVDRCALLGTSHIRVFAGSLQPGMDEEAARKLAIEALEECCDYAGKHGIFLGLENHGGIVAEPDQVLEIIRAVQSKWIGINLDSGNFHTDPYGDFEKCAPYAVNVQIKEEITVKPSKTPEKADLVRVLDILRKTNYQGFVALEYESKEDPWTAVPRLLKQL